MFFDGETHRLQIDVLSHGQRSFLYTTLCNILKLYVSSASKLHPGILATAIHHAVNECTADRQTRAKSLFHTLSEPKTRRARWMGEFREAMENAHGDPSNDGQNLEKANSDRLVDWDLDDAVSRSRHPGVPRMPTLSSVVTERASRNSEVSERTAVHNLDFHTITPDELQVCLQRRASEILGKKGRFWEVSGPPLDVDADSTDEDMMVAVSSRTVVRNNDACLEERCSELANEEVELLREVEQLHLQLQDLSEVTEAELTVVPQAPEELTALQLGPASSLLLPTLRLGLARHDSNVSKL